MEFKKMIDKKNIYTTLTNSIVPIMFFCDNSYCYSTI